MPLDPQVQELLDVLAAVGSGRDTADGTPDEARFGYEFLHTSLAAAPDSEAVPSISDEFIPGPGGSLAVRIYRPAALGPRPTIAFFHGGGWTIGSIASHDGQARLLCAGTRAVVVAVEYRLAPEHPFPAALLDCEATVRWCFANATSLGGRPEAVAVAGDSAGGNLAAAVALRMRAQSPALAGQLLVYPATDSRRSTRSYAENGEGYFLTARTMRWFWENYLAGAAPTPDVSVLDAPDLSGVAPAVVVTAEFDPLRDEGAAYAQRLRDAGVAATLIECPGLIHGFFAMTTRIHAAAEATSEFLAAFSALLDPAPGS